MPEPRYGIRSKLLVLFWLLILSVIGVVKIIVGSISADGGCLGLYLLPYYHLLGGILSLLPALMSLLVSFCGQTKNLQDVWCLMANVLFVSFLLIFSGTIYVITNTVRVTNLDRLCTHTWVPIFSLCSLAVDWLLIFFFYRLFCIHDMPAPPPLPADLPVLEDSPFHLWRMRNNYLRRTF